ncbi:calcium homeostasis modulator protein 5-like [Actinia tenebrosa]|uniref:Calcium homeostasis modulator protein 5-like n=1 Tax=Actinia tenebrosa TaxID=6105 RepID=A0A6P8II93_ACTTE|nr:calcium homeostasis modulator protein 5-like [Actinia tenebrosa]
MAVDKPNVVATAKELINDNTATLRNIIATLFVFAFQALVTTADLFKCPSKGNASYGCMFIFVPALVLFLISLLLSESFKKVSQGCCYTVDPSKQIVRKYCPCSRPRWCCNKEMLTVFFYSFMAGCLWIFWALLQKGYYTCAVFGNEDQLKNVTGKNKTILEKRYQNAQTESQIYGFTLLALILGIPLLFITIRRCCYLRPLASVPSLFEYEKLEAKAAEAKLKEKIEAYATAQGEGKAERHFAEHFKADKSIADIIREARAELSSIKGYSEALDSLDKYKKLEAEAVRGKFKDKVEELAEGRVTVTFEDKTWKEYEDDDPYDFVENVYESISSEYPRVTGDQSKPYKKYKHIGKRGEIEMTERHDEA